MADPLVEVANPRRAGLVALRNDLAREVAALRAALKRPDEAMSGDEVWVGRNARAWRQELHGRHRRLRQQADRLLPLLDAALREEPERVTRAEAQAYHRRG